MTLQILRGMLVVLEEACRISLYIGVAEVVDVLLKGLLNVLKLLGGVLCLVLVEFTCSVLQLVGCGTFATLGDHLADPALGI